MKHSLPVLRLGGTRFLMDVEGLLLRQVDNPSNVISIRKMRDEGSFYIFAYHLERKNITTDYHRDKVQLFAIPQMVALDPEGMRRKYGLASEAPLPGRDADCKCNPTLIESRITFGKLPVMDILGKPYYVDWRMEELRAHIPYPEPFMPSLIRLIELPFYERKYFYPKNAFDVGNPHIFRFLYDREKHQDVLFDPYSTGYGKNVVVLQIPFERALDPVAVARQLEMDERALVDQYPLRENLSAKIIPWGQTSFREFSGSMPRNSRSIGLVEARKEENNLERNG